MRDITITQWVGGLVLFPWKREANYMVEGEGDACIKNLPVLWASHLTCRIKWKFQSELSLLDEISSHWQWAQTSKCIWELCDTSRYSSVKHTLCNMAYGVNIPSFNCTHLMDALESKYIKDSVLTDFWKKKRMFLLLFNSLLISLWHRIENPAKHIFRLNTFSF